MTFQSLHLLCPSSCQFPGASQATSFETSADESYGCSAEPWVLQLQGASRGQTHATGPRRVS